MEKIDIHTFLVSIIWGVWPKIHTFSLLTSQSLPFGELVWIQDGNRAGSGQKTVPKSNPTFHLDRTGLGQFCKSISQIRAHFGTFWVWVGSGRAGLNKPDNFSPF
jgi:hypothetical protein